MLLKITVFVCVLSVAQCTTGFHERSYRREYSDDHENKDSHEYENNSNEKVRNAHNKKDRTKNEIYTPCKLDDIKCIRKEMADNSNCDPRVFGSVPDPVAVPSFEFEAPYFSASFNDQYLAVKNLKKCVVTAFYTNLTSDATILGLDCPDLTFEANRTVIQHRELKQDLLYKYNVFMVYRMLRITINLRPSSALDLCRTRAYNSISELKNLQLLPYDKATEEFIKHDTMGIFKRHRTIFDREVALYAVNMYMRLFVNNRICNFRCKSLF